MNTKAHLYLKYSLRKYSAFRDFYQPLNKFNKFLPTLNSSKPDTPTRSYSSILQSCIDSNSKEDEMYLRNHFLATGLASDLNLNNKSIILHYKFANLNTARKIFVDMPERNVVSWTAMISGYSKNGFCKEAVNLFSLMHHSGLSPNQFTFGSTLQACTRMGILQIGEQIHARIEKTRFSSHTFVQSALLDLHLKHGLVSDAQSLFNRMERKDVVSWNSIIGGYAFRGEGYNAFELFFSMLRDGFLPDHFTFTNVLRACHSGSTQASSNIVQIHAFVIKLGYDKHRMVTGSLIYAYANCRNMSSARLLYDLTPTKDIVSCTALINGHVLEKRSSYKEAFDFFCEIHRMGMSFDDIILCSMLSICADEASLCMGRQIHALVLKDKPSYDVALSNSLIDMYAKSGELEDAHQAFNEARQQNVISWTSLITSYAKHGYGEDAITLFSKMEDSGVKPNEVTFLSLLFACSHSGLTNKGINYFNLMTSKYGINPRGEHYTCIVDLLARGGLLKQAYEIAYNMNVKPNTSLWGSMLGACSMHGNLSLGKIAASHLFDLDPEKSLNYIVLSNMYAAAGLWDSSIDTRKLIDDTSINKIAGKSLLA